jgi:transcriptional regulator with XRE-family HTH domain
MTEQSAGSTVPRRQLGRYLRDLRGQSRFTVKAAARALQCSEVKIWRIEGGHTSTSATDVEQLCHLYGAPNEVTAGLMALAKQTRAKGWWMSFSDVIPEGFDLYFGLEEAAERLNWYEVQLVPGLLQVDGYTRALIRTDRPDLDEVETERRVQLRMKRQALITRPNAAPELRVVLHESILRCPVGGKHVMRAQLARLVEACDLPTVTLKVLPNTASTHAGLMSGPFVLLEFPRNGLGEPTEPSTVYVDGMTGALFLDKPAEITRYATAFNGIWNAALDPAASRDLIAAAIEEFT